jgi:hypothetical protein
VISGRGNSQLSANSGPNPNHGCVSKLGQQLRLLLEGGSCGSCLPVHLRGAGKVAENRGHHHHDVFWGPMRRESCIFYLSLAHTTSRGVKNVVLIRRQSVRQWLSLLGLARGQLSMRREAANRVTVDCWYRRRCGAVGVDASTSAYLRSRGCVMDAIPRSSSSSSRRVGYDAASDACSNGIGVFSVS